MNKDKPAVRPKRKGTLVEIQIFAAIVLSLAMAKLILDYHELGPPDDDHTYATAVLIILPMSLIVGFVLATMIQSRSLSSYRKYTYEEIQPMLRVFWLVWAFFWIVTAIVAYVF